MSVSTSDSIIFFTDGCGERRPTDGMIKRKMDSEGWKSNRPTPGSVILSWEQKVQDRLAVMSDPRIKASIESQKWRGLQIHDFGEPKGKGRLIIIFSDTCLSKFQLLLKKPDPQRYTLFFFIYSDLLILLSFQVLLQRKTLPRERLSQTITER